jgi:hypothetical protein
MGSAGVATCGVFFGEECDCNAPCQTCGEHGTRCEPCYCGRQAIASIRLATLARNLAVAGGLCAAHRSGFVAGWSCSGEGFNAEYARPRDPNWYEKMYADSTVNDYTGERDCWRPGCGRAVR